MSTQMNGMASIRGEHEIAHGKWLAKRNPDVIWGWQSPAGHLRARRRADLIAAGASLGSGIQALEIGCETGLFTEMFAQTGGQLVAVDISAALLEKARARGLPHERVRFVEKRFEECDMNDIGGPFDAVIGSSVLHHLEIGLALEVIRKLVKPGGVMSFAEPNMLNPQVFVERKLTSCGLRLRHVSPDETAFVRWRLRSLLLKLGFQGVEITPFDWLHPATPASIISVVSGAGRILERLPGLREFAGSLYIRARRPSPS